MDAQVGPDAAEMADAAQMADAAVVDLGPPPAVVDPARQIEAESLLATPVNAVVALPDDAVLAESQGALHLIDANGAVDLGPGEDLRGAAMIDGALVVALGGGLFIETEAGLVASPLAEHLGEVRGLTTTGDGALWVVDEEGLHVWRDGTLRGVHPEGEMPWAEARYAPGAWAGEAALWIGGAERLLAVSLVDAQPMAWAVDVGAPIDGLAANSEGGVWLLAGGELWHVDVDGDWQTWALPFVPTALAGHHRAPDLWLAEGDALWQYREGRFRPVEGVAPFDGLRAEDDGSVLLHGAGGLDRVRPGRFVRLSGVDEGDVLEQMRAVAIEPTRPDLIARLTATIDEGAPMALAGPPWAVELVPVELGEGPHVLTVAATYTDDLQVEVQVHFVVQGPPTWRGHVEPLFVARCDQCHGERGYAHRMDDPNVWQIEIAAILSAVEAGRMPLTPNPALTPAEIDQIRRWRDAGFPETWP
ncbi:MAG: hypothetical protein KC620_08305 [Myxococcales bacterium]|nr:hypothetical protein [Myxococcales bacterium]